MDAVRQEVQRQARLQAGVTLVLVDLDRFKEINDQFGHRAGDQVLQTFAEATRACLRSSDLVGRWGGEEFLLVMAVSEPPGAFTGIERLRSALRSVQIETCNKAIEVTFSAGVAQCTRLGISMQR